MPIVVTERFGRSRNRDRGTRLYLVTGTSDPEAARDAAIAEAPDTLGDLFYDDAAYEEIPGQSEMFLIEVTYAKSTFQERETGDEVFAFDTSGGTQHITHGLATISASAPDGEPVPATHGAIGVTEEGVSGVDILAKTFRFTVTRYMPKVDVTSAFIGAVYALTGTVNDDTVTINVDGQDIPFASGELLFEGAAGSKRGDEDWEITFRFAASPNRTDVEIDDITVAAKKGWEYLWVRYAIVSDDTAHMLTQKPVAAYVEKVYELGDFGDIGF